VSRGEKNGGTLRQVELWSSLHVRGGKHAGWRKNPYRYSYLLKTQRGGGKTSPLGKVGNSIFDPD